MMHSSSQPQHHPNIALIAAVSENGVIGNNNGLPWHLPEDLKYFRKTTLGKPVIMGRKTFESMGSKPLPERINIILSQNLNFQKKIEAEKNADCIVLPSVESVLSLKAVQQAEEIMVIGGEKIFEAFLPFSGRLYINLVHQVVEGDTFFPKVHWRDWRLVEEHPHAGFSARIFERISTSA